MLAPHTTAADAGMSWFAFCGVGGMAVLVLNAGADSDLPKRSRQLREAGCRVVEATSWRDTLATMAEELPAVLVATHFPDTTPADAFRAVRQDTRTALIKVLYLAEPGFQPSDHVQWLESGANLVMPLTTPADVLVAQVKALSAWMARSYAVLEESEARFRQISEATPFGIAIVDLEDEAIVFSNPASDEALGYARGALVGHRISEVYGESREGKRLLTTVREEGRFSNVEIQLRRRDGSTFWALGSARGIRYGGRRAAIAVLSDITERRVAQRAVAESRERYQAIFEVAPFAIALFDSQQRIVEANKECESMFGFTRGEALGKTPVELGTLQAPDLQHLYSLLDQERTVHGVELHYNNRRGERCLGEFAIRRVSVDGQSYFLGTAVDVTRQRRAELDLQHANALLEESDRRKDEFIAMLSHELRNPLAPIRYALPLLEPVVADDQQGQQALTVLHRQVDHLTRLVDDLLDVSRISGGIIELRREHRELASVVTAAVEAAMPAISAADHTLDVDLGRDSILVYADPARLSQIITNLLNNSARYTPHGGAIRLTARVAGDAVVIRVQDTGIGIPAQALANVFEMFTQVKRPGRSQGGLGIGLALVKRLVEMHGGTVCAESGGAGKGSTFTVSLPVVHGAPPVQQNPREGSTPRAVSPCRVLVVDDNADLVEMLAIALAAFGHVVQKALDGPSALDAAASFRPDVVVLDLGLPVMNGLEVAAELRRRPETADACLIALTGWGQAEDRLNTRRAGFDYHVTKPADPLQLHRIVSDVAHRKGAHGCEGERGHVDPGLA